MIKFRDDLFQSTFQECAYQAQENAVDFGNELMDLSPHGFQKELYNLKV